MGISSCTGGVFRCCFSTILILVLAACSESGSSPGSTPIDNIDNTVAGSVQMSGNKVADGGIESLDPSETLTKTAEFDSEEDTSKDGQDEEPKVIADTKVSDEPQSVLLKSLEIIENSGMDFGDIVNMMGRYGFDSQDTLGSLLPFLATMEGESCVAADISAATQIFNNLESVAGGLSLDDLIRQMSIDATDNLYVVLHDLLAFAKDNALLCDDTLSILQYLGEAALTHFGLQATSLIELLDQFGLTVDLSLSEAIKIVGIGSQQEGEMLTAEPDKTQILFVASEAADPVGLDELIQIIGDYEDFLGFITIDELIAVLPIDTTESLEDNLDGLLTFASEQLLLTDNLLLLLGQWSDIIVSSFGSKASNLTELLDLFGLNGDLTLEDVLNIFI